MGGHGGLNILPQKRWNVYNFDNREKVRKDEEAAARDEQIKREQSRKRDTEVRLERLRTSRGLAPTIPEPEPKTEPKAEPEVEVEVKAEAGDPGHINLFEGIKIFDPIRVPKRDIEGEKEELKMKTKKLKLRKEPGESSIRAVGPEDEVYRLGYGIAGKGVQLPWYVQNKKLNDDDDVGGGVNGENSGGDRRGEKRKKTLEELREERLKRERKEKEREMALRHPKQSRREAFGSSRYYDRYK
ncbi:hypothetical protein L195_g004365 [Trifolium pratense]|uniref:CBF1-interacting co-repressor CIR N-terminal domain-containing protein n=1 Tax=Trifolium pratense TaxID=57577 RepID=A0A2K3NXW0_TRIPR|nr:hypothetical protein L195_g000569 [Trifolium pratense]PNY07859.1 hypothetical protein L195_g004365 [Trifolium pratense]